MVTICKLCQIVYVRKKTQHIILRFRAFNKRIGFFSSFLMDKTARPLKIPPEYLHYADRHSLFEFFQVIYSLIQ